MRGIEAESVLRNEETQDVTKVVRAFTVAPVPIENLNKHLQQGLPIDLFSFSEVVMLEKSSQSVSSANLLITPGGRMSEGESVFASALREVGEETMFLTQSLTGVKDWEAQNQAEIPSFIFQIPRYRQPREAHLVVVPVRSSSFSLHVPREGRDGPVDKIKDLVGVPLPQFQLLVENGYLDHDGRRFRIVGHLTKAPSEIEIAPAEAAKKNQALDQVLAIVWQFEDKLRQQTLQEINKARRLQRKLQVQSLEQCSHYEIINGFLAAQMVLGMQDEYHREQIKGDAPPDIADLPIVAQFLSALAPEAMNEFILSLPTRRARRALRVFRKALGPVASQLTRSLGKSLLEETQPDLDYRSPLQLLSDLWPDFLAQSLDQRNLLLIQLNERFVDEVARQLGISRGRVKHALEEAHAYPQYYTDSLRALGPQFQQGRRMNEIANARLLTLTLIAMGLHPNLVPVKEERPEVLQALRFEAMVTLADFIAALEALEIRKTADNSLIEGALDTFLRFPPQPEVIDLGSGILHPVYHRQTQVAIGGRPLHLVVDERLVKDEASIMRKRYQSSQFFDLFSINLVLAEDNFGGKQASNNVRFILVRELREALVEHIGQELNKDNWRVNIVPEMWNRKSVINVEEYLKIKDKRRRQVFINSLHRGKRPGSIGDLIVREKFVLALSRDKEVHYCEFCIYPYEQLSEGVGELSASGFMGFREKLQDDATGMYNALRLIVRDTQAPTRSSLYELEFPPFLYEWRILQMMRRQIRPHWQLPVIETSLRQWFLRRWFSLWRK